MQTDLLCCLQKDYKSGLPHYWPGLFLNTGCALTCFGSILVDLWKTFIRIKWTLGFLYRKSRVWNIIPCHRWNGFPFKPILYYRFLGLFLHTGCALTCFGSIFIDLWKTFIRKKLTSWLNMERDFPFKLILCCKFWWKITASLIQFFLSLDCSIHSCL